MRADMKHVIIDRPRRGGDGGRSKPPKGYRRALRRIPPDEQPRTESRARLYGGLRKRLNEHLGPLRRWLRSQCGRPWDKVHAEICARLRVENATQAHVRDHAEEYVVRDAQLIDGEVCDSKGLPLRRHYPWRWRPFYVDPRDGTLRELPRGRLPRYEAKGLDFVPGQHERHQYRLFNGCWFEVELAPALDLPWRLQRRLGICWLGLDLMYVKSRRQLPRKEIERLRLWQTPLGRRPRRERPD
jgi:hypothetical protein